jgi:hypothetical protein
VAAMIERDAFLAELLEIESLLQDDRLNDQDRYALRRTAGPCDISWSRTPGTKPSQTFYRINNRPSKAVSLLLH